MIPNWKVSRVTWRAPVLAAGLCLAAALAATAQDGGAARPSALASLVIWMPFILKGFGLNLLMSVLAMGFATVMGVILGFMQISPVALIRVPARLVTHLFRNSPWLVILFAIMLLVPFQMTLPGVGRVMIPDWVKATFGFALPVMANISEILRGAVLSIPSGQWESAESLAFTRGQTLRHVILPQCIRRMLPPWMNWYALLTLMTPMAAILGVDEALGNTQAAMEAAGARPEFLIPFYLFLMTIFFVFIYPLSVYTRRLEKRFAVAS
ncbi:polar amino acid ABC transporter permease [Sulfitobacter sp. EhC04]|uniref:amino acid ABC transporter permease n=1 Tax=Sulfitobacter sp. EhC04 TaxID=1849168 RepID=UPI0007F53BDF|nr:amino acid ABC transporter permease [Sulfitobacter sp. EhC04]OAN70958.1 polar amino acid ABC transporter permease [Sulfitobacter sp. EhC04]